MDDALTVRLGDAARQRFDQLGRPPRRPGRAVEPPVQAAAVDELQLEERQAVGLADVVDLHDVGVLQAGDGLRLGQEAGGGLGAGMGAGQDHLQGAGAVQADLPGLVDDAHAAAAQLAQDLVAGDGGDGAAGRLRGGAAIATWSRRRAGHRSSGWTPRRRRWATRPPCPRDRFPRAS